MYLAEPTRRLLEKLGYDSLYPVQEEALKAGVERGESLVVAAPTASGKTLIPMIAIVNMRERRGLKAIYTAPLRSIAMEKYREFSVLESICCRVGLLIGDYEAGSRRPDVIITTYEKLDSMLRNSPDMISDIGVLVVDEVHYVGNEDRGFPLESLIAKILYRGDPQIIALSATIPNADDLARWLNARLIKSEWRPVPLREAVFKNYKLYYSSGEIRSVEKLVGYPDVDLALDSIGAGGQCIVFTQSRRRAAQLASRAARTLRGRSGWSRLDASRIAREMLASDGPRKIREELAALIEKGVAYHHAGLSNTHRSLVEEAFRTGAIALLYATPTLAAGVNLPARRVVIESYYRYSMGYWEPISVSEYKQLAGRAGRPGLDDEGEAVIIAARSDSVDDVLSIYVKAPPERVESKLGGIRGIRHSVLGAIASGIATTVDELLELHKRTLYYIQRPPRMVPNLISRAIQSLSSWGLVVSEGDELRATRLGLEVSRHYIDPETVQIVRRLMDSMSSLGEKELLFIVASAPDMEKPLVSKREEENIMDELLDYSPDIVKSLEWLGPEELRSAKAALVLWAWINEASDDEIMDRYGVEPGDLALMVDTATWIASSLSAILRAMGRSDASEPMSSLEKRLRYGVKDELLQLVSIPMVGRAKARRLYNAGYRSIRDLESADPEELLRIEGVGPATVRAIMEFLGRIDEARGLDRKADVERRGLLYFMED